MSSVSLLRSPALGTALSDLIRPCGASRPRRSRLPAPPRHPPLAVALSGGGFRATLSGLGVLRFLADAGLLTSVRYVSSVSGGSVANGLFACRYRQLEEAGFTAEAFDHHLLGPFVEQVSTRSLSRLRYGHVPLVRDLQLAQSLLYRQSTALRGRWMVERFRAALLAASFDRFPRQRCDKLVHAGWWLTGASLATYHRDMLGSDLPVWRPPP